MKVFFPVEALYPSQAGGVANSVYWLAKNLAKKGVEPVIVASDKGLGPGTPINRWIESESGKVIFVKTRSLNFPIRQTIVALCNFYSADIIHLSSIFYPVAFATAIFGRIFKKKIVWSIRGEMNKPALEHSRGRKRPILWCIKRLFRNHALFHSTTDAETEVIRNVFGTNAKIFQLTNYIEVSPLAVRSPGKYILLLGRFHPIKGIDNLIKALAISQGFLESEYVLRIAGKGLTDVEKAIRDLVSEKNLSHKVTFAGHVEGREKEELLANAYVTIVPSHSESFGIVVLESLAQNTPVIASKGSPWEVLDKERIGFWAENSPEVLAQTLDKILRMDMAEYDGYRERGRKFVVRNFDITENITRWLEVYEGLK